MMRTLLLTTITIFSCTVSFAQWSPAITNFPADERDGAASFVIDNKAYIAGGILAADLHTFDGTSWVKKSDIASGAFRCFAAPFVVNNKAYLLGGDSSFGTAMAELWAYDPSLGNWTQKTDFPGGKRIGMAVWVANGRVFAGGGTDEIGPTGYGNVYDDLYEYQVAEDKWRLLSKMLPMKLAFPSSFVIDNKCYLVFGEDETGKEHNELYQFDSTTGSGWKTLTAFPGQGRSAGVAAVLGNKAYAGLGQKNFSDLLNDFYEYDAGTDKWRKEQDYPGSESAWSTAFALNGKLYAGTGAGFDGLQLSKTFYAFTPGGPTGVEEGVQDAFLAELFPNPSAGRVLMRTDREIERIDILDMSGRMVFSRECGQSRAVSIDLHGLDRAIYQVIVHAPDAVVRKRLIIE